MISSRAVSFLGGAGVLMGTLLLGACGSEEEDQGLLGPTLNGEAPADYATTYNKINAVRTQSDPHMATWVSIFVNNTGMTVWEAGSGTFPVGTIVVKEMYAGEEDTDPAGWTIMEKAGEGYDPELNDWHCLKIGGDGSIPVDARCSETPCAGCHAAADADKDMLLYPRGQ